MATEQQAPPSIEEEEYSGVLSQISPFRIMLAAMIGLAVVIYMFISEFNAEEFSKITWSSHVFIWIGMAMFFMCFRHFCYMVRLRIITDGFFSWKKCFELVMMWEFSSAVTPTSVGGAAVAMFAIAQEKISAGKTAMIVLYTVVVDTFSFLTALIFFYLIFGAIMVQPGASNWSELMGTQWGIAFVSAYSLMLVYGGLFFYGVLINAKSVQKILLFLCKLPFLKRFREKAIQVTDDMDLASGELRQKGIAFHLGTYLSTMAAWASRFMVLNCLIVAFVAYSPNPEIQQYYNDFMTGQMNLDAFGQQVFIYARQQAMYVIMAVMPSPGGAGVAEYAFKTFHFDYIPTDEHTTIAVAGTLMVIMATLWRTFTYYVYLLVGSIVVPNWVNKIIKRNKEERLAGKTSTGLNDNTTYNSLTD
jgi:uncharacterized membrane protein YbhN (UPF0104 family)